MLCTILRISLMACVHTEYVIMKLHCLKQMKQLNNSKSWVLPVIGQNRLELLASWQNSRGSALRISSLRGLSFWGLCWSHLSHWVLLRSRDFERHGTPCRAGLAISNLSMSFAVCLYCKANEKASKCGCFRWRNCWTSKAAWEMRCIS